jgi:hypothetical protein
VGISILDTLLSLNIQRFQLVCVASDFKGFLIYLLIESFASALFVESFAPSRFRAQSLHGILDPEYSYFQAAAIFVARSTGVLCLLN